MSKRHDAMRPRKTSIRWGVCAKNFDRRDQLPGARVMGALCPKCGEAPDHYDVDIVNVHHHRYLTTLRFYTNGHGVLFEECTRCDYSAKVSSFCGV
jgi:hypothetical protein